jgi:nucleoside 2-deoxyribosyltransferase
MKLYLAGPEVFLPDAVEVGRRKCALCAHYGHIGLFPLDNIGSIAPGERLARLIFVGNLGLIREADAVIANLSPFRGCGADPGTVFEVGFAHALGKPVHGYSCDPRTLLDRVSAGEAAPLRQAGDGRLFAADGLAVEDFGLFENLMIAEALTAFHAGRGAKPGAEGYMDLALFETALAAIRR